MLEADGRTAGGLATLRFRPLAGERRNIAALAHEAHKLGKQVERLSAVLDAAPLPVWLRGADGKLVWVNQAYAASVEAPDGDVVVKAGTEIAGHASLDRPAAKPDHRLCRPHPCRHRRRRCARSTSSRCRCPTAPQASPST